MFSVGNYLKKDGRILLLFSSHSGKQKVHDAIHKAGFKYVELAKEHIFFEDLLVYYVARP